MISEYIKIVNLQTVSVYVIIKKNGEVSIMQYIPYIISLLSLLLAAYSFASKNNKENTTELTTVIVKLENIGSGITDIKSEIASMKNDQKDDHDRLIKVEASVATMWKRYDELKANANL